MPIIVPSLVFIGSNHPGTTADAPKIWKMSEEFEEEEDVHVRDSDARVKLCVCQELFDCKQT